MSFYVLYYSPGWYSSWEWRIVTSPFYDEEVYWELRGAYECRNTYWKHTLDYEPFFKKCKIEPKTKSLILKFYLSADFIFENEEKRNLHLVFWLVDQCVTNCIKESYKDSKSQGCLVAKVRNANPNFTTLCVMAGQTTNVTSTYRILSLIYLRPIRKTNWKTISIIFKNQGQWSSIYFETMITYFRCWYVRWLVPVQQRMFQPNFLQRYRRWFFR